MGNLPSNRGEKRQNSRSNISLDSVKDKIKPLQVFGLNDLDRDELISYLKHPTYLLKKYKELMMQHHPDRGGSSLKCVIINYSYEKIKEAQDNILADIEFNKTNHTGEELKKHFKNQAEDKEVVNAMKRILKESNPEQFSKQFNEAFELSRMKDYTDDGYEEGDKTTSIQREPIQVPTIHGVTQSNLNEMFHKNTKVNTALIVHEDKQPEGISSLKHQVFEYGKKKETDFGRMTNGATDYSIAFGGERLIDFEQTRPKDRDLSGKVSMDTVKHLRSNQNLDPNMTEKEREIWAKQQEEDELEEEHRNANQVEMDYEIGKRQNIFIERMLTFSNQ